MTGTEQRTIGGAALVALLAFLTGLGVALVDSAISAADAALVAFTEAFVAGVVAGLGGWAITHRKPAHKAD